MSFTVDSICKVDFYDVSKTISVKRGLRTSICLSEHVRNGHFFQSNQIQQIDFKIEIISVRFLRILISY